jgi:UDP-4-amino-4-deoxy-L-arabinose formyltransferase/UDP-glucuronic acid dehydrogenase (UDP-4-keto-hexauronic acid decarboxylating)
VTARAPRVVVCAYGAFGHAGLAALLRSGAKVALLLSHADQPGESCWWPSVAELARAHGVPVVLDADLKGDGEGSAYARLRALAPDYIFSFYFRHMIPERVLALAAQGGWNLHGSLLPAYRGRAPVNWQLVNGELRSGLTLHRMVRQADAGDIAAQVAVDVHPDVDAFGLTAQLLAQADVLLDAVLPALFAGRAALRVQDHAQATVVRGRTPADGLIDWAWPARRVHDLVRAVAPPWPSAFTWCAGRKLLVQRSAVRAESGAGAAPGTLLPGAAGAWAVACGAGVLELLSVVEADGRPALLAPGARLSAAPTATSATSSLPPQRASGNP